MILLFYFLFIIMLFSGVVPLFFTLFTLTGITNQGDCGNCTAHAVFNCLNHGGYQASGVWGWLVSYGASCERGTHDSYVDLYLYEINVKFTKISPSQDLIVSSLKAWFPIVASLQNLKRYENKEIKVFSGYVEKEWKVWNTVLKYKKKQYKTITVKDPIMPVYSTGWEWHAVCIIGYNASGAVFQNSFGASYGERGFWFVPWDIINGSLWRIEK